MPRLSICIPYWGGWMQICRFGRHGGRPLLYLCVVLSLGYGATLSAGDLRVGIDRVEMDFPEGLTMWGYTPRPNQGLLDPLVARIFVFENDSNRVALVTLDLGRTFGDPRMDRVRRRVEESVGVEDVFFTASHTHSGPYLHDVYPDGPTPDWVIAVVDQIAEGIERAARTTFRARLGVGSGRVEIGHNRRFVRADGSVRMLWANPTRISTYPVDSEVLVLRIDDDSGGTRGILVGYSCHPVVFGPDNLLYSADFPGAMASFVRGELSGEPVVAFVQGAPGDINPFLDKRELTEGAVQSRIEVGEKLGREVLRVAQAIETRPSPESSIEAVRETMTFRSRAQPSAETIDGDLTVLLLDDRYAFVGFPGEPFVEFQLELKRWSDFDAAFFMGYTNGYVRYFPTIRAAVEGGYGADRQVSIVEVGAGERMLRRAKVRLLEMTGRLAGEPASPGR